MRRRSAAALAVGMLVAALVGSAAPVGADDGGGPSAQATIANLIGGGPGSGSSWNIGDNGSGVSCAFTGSGLNVVDAALDPSGLDQTDAYDFAFTGFLDGTIYPGSPNSTNGSSQVTGGPVTLSGLQVGVRYDTIPGATALLREVVTFTNPGSSPIAATWTEGYNMGSDSATQVLATGSGDATLSADDSYSVTSDGNTSGTGDPVNTLVYFGNGNVLHPTFNGGCPNTFNGSDRLAEDWAVTVPPGGTVRLMFLGVLGDSTDPAASVAAAPGFPAITASSPILAGLSADELASILNWDFPLVIAPVLTVKFTG